MPTLRKVGEICKLGLRVALNQTDSYCPVSMVQVRARIALRPGIVLHAEVY